MLVRSGACVWVCRRVGQPVVESLRSAGDQFCRRITGRDGGSGESRELLVGQAETGPRRFVLAEQAGAEQQRIVGAECARDTGVEQSPYRMVGQGRDDPDGVVRGRADVQADPRRRSSSTVPGSSIARIPWAIRRAPRRWTAARTLPGPAISPACGAAVSPASRAMANAAANGSIGKTASFPASPKACTPRPACRPANRARSTAASGP
jgi:hypothetical protein